ncbi:MAG: DUF2341 domain-containing protein [Thermoplasmatales archaeon]|nr:DUF2341 domain-containing protein [Thermoplasmatales archaeon]
MALDPSSGWSGYYALNISNSVADYTMQLIIKRGNGTNDPANNIIYEEGHCYYSDMKDHRFGTTNSPVTSTQLGEWTESYTDGVERKVWLKIPSSAPSTIYLFCGNSGASEYSSGEDTFLWFDNASTDKRSSYGFYSVGWDGGSYSLSWSSGYYQITKTSGTGHHEILLGIIPLGEQGDIELYVEILTNVLNVAGLGARRTSTPAAYSFLTDISQSPDTHAISYKTTGVDTSLAQTSSGNLSSGTYYKYLARAYGSNLYYRFESVEISATDTTLTSGLCGVWCYSWRTGYYSRFKNLRVRKYLTTNPSWNSFGSWTSPGFYSKTCTDTVTLSDTIAKGISTIKQDGMGLSDLSVKKPDISRADNITLNELLSKYAEVKKLDNITLNELLSKYAEVKKLDNITLNELLSKYAEVKKLDTISLSDNIITELVLSIILEDTLQLLDELKKSTSKNIEEIANLQESISKYLQVIKSENITLSDSILLTFFLILSDSINIADIIIKNALLERQDVINLIDSIKKSANITKSDAILLVDFLQKLIYIASISEIIKLEEAIKKKTYKELQEYISLDEVYQIFKILKIILEENIYLDDACIASFSILLPFALAIIFKKLYERNALASKLYETNIEFAKLYETNIEFARG